MEGKSGRKNTHPPFWWGKGPTFWWGKGYEFLPYCCVTVRKSLGFLGVLGGELCAWKFARTVRWEAADA
jgi:hypothetical protein